MRRRSLQATLALRCPRPRAAVPRGRASRRRCRPAARPGRGRAASGGRRWGSTRAGSLRSGGQRLARRCSIACGGTSASCAAILEQRRAGHVRRCRQRVVHQVHQPAQRVEARGVQGQPVARQPAQRRQVVAGPDPHRAAAGRPTLAGKAVRQDPQARCGAAGPSPPGPTPPVRPARSRRPRPAGAVAARRISTAPPMLSPKPQQPHAWMQPPHRLPAWWPRRRTAPRRPASRPRAGAAPKPRWSGRVQAAMPDAASTGPVSSQASRLSSKPCSARNTASGGSGGSQARYGRRAPSRHGRTSRRAPAARRARGSSRARHGTGRRASDRARWWPAGFAARKPDAARTKHG